MLLLYNEGYFDITLQLDMPFENINYNIRSCSLKNKSTHVRLSPAKAINCDSEVMCNRCNRYQKYKKKHLVLSSDKVSTRNYKPFFREWGGQVWGRVQGTFLTISQNMKVKDKNRQTVLYIFNQLACDLSLSVISLPFGCCLQYSADTMISTPGEVTDSRFKFRDA